MKIEMTFLKEKILLKEIIFLRYLEEHIYQIYL